jgi:hypothetical protein
MWVWKTPEGHNWPRREFVELPCKQPTFQHLLVALEFVKSPSAAQRAIEKGELLWTPYYEERFRTVKKFNEEIPGGWPIEVLWRRQRHAEVMHNNAKQIRRVWNRLMPHTPPSTWWDHWVGLLEQWVRA